MTQSKSRCLRVSPLATPVFILTLALMVCGTHTSIAQCSTPSFAQPSLLGILPCPGPGQELPDCGPLSTPVLCHCGPQAAAVFPNGSDLAIANEVGRNVDLFLGGFNLVPFAFPTGANPSGGIAFGDFNGDGAVDLVVAGQVVLFGDAGNLFGPPSVVGSGAGYSAATGDFNDDGIDDLAVVNGDSVSILLGPSLIGQSFPAGSRDFSRNSIAVADFDGDGNLDVVVTNPGASPNAGSGNTVLVLLGDGTGELGAAKAFTVGTNPLSLVVGKFNADSILDLAVMSNDGVSILLGDGAGGFVPHVNLTGGDFVEQGIASADFNGDGKLDLVDTQGIWLGDGTGNFGPHIQLDVQVNSHSVAVGDFDADGKPDLAFTGEGDDKVEILLNACPAAPCKLTCPANITQCNDLGVCGAVVNYSPPTASGTCGTVNCTPASGTLFSIGATKVTCSGAGDATCSFTVTVNNCASRCPLGQGFWKNHPAAWPANSLSLGTVPYTATELFDILNTAPGSAKKADASLILARQLIVAKLNLADNSDPCPIAAAIAAADDLIDNAPIPIDVPPNTEVGVQMTDLADALENFNNGLMSSGCTP